MGKSSFTDIDAKNVTEADAEVTQQTETTAIAPQNTAVANAEDFNFQNDGFADEIDARNINIPFIKLVHGVGDLSREGFAPGSLVFDKNLVLLEPAKPGKSQEPLTIHPLNGMFGGLDYIEYPTNAQYEAYQAAGLRGGGPFKNEVEAKAAGYVTSKEAKEIKRLNPAANPLIYGPRLSLCVLVEGNKDSNFPYEFGGKTYNRAALVLTKGSYYSAGKDLYTGVVTARQLNKANPGQFPLFWTSWHLTTKFWKAPGAVNGAFNVNAKQGTKTSPEFIAWVKATFNLV